MPIARPSCPVCEGYMSPGPDAENMICPDCRSVHAEGSLTVRWTIPKKLFSSKRTRLTLRTRSPDLLFTLQPNIIPDIGEERGGRALLSSYSAAVNVRLLQCSAAFSFLHLMSASVSDGGHTEVDHSFECSSDFKVPLQVDLRAIRESNAESLQLTFVLCWVVCL